MKKSIFIILHVFLLFACVNKPQTEVQLNSDSIDLKEEQLFLIPALNDTLEVFMQTVGDIPNPLNAPKVNNIIISLIDRKDTMIAYIAKVGLDIIPYNYKKSKFFIKGGCQIKDEYVAIYYGNLDSLSTIINEYLLDSFYIEKLKKESPIDTLTTEWFYEGYNWIYRLHGDSLIEMKKIKVWYGGYDYILP